MMKQLIAVLAAFSLLPLCACTRMAESNVEQQTDVMGPVTAVHSAPKPETGRTPLPTVLFSVSDPDNSRGLSTARIEHCFGAASGGKAHEISVNNQAAFDKSGTDAVCLDTKSKGKVLYLTFDSGYETGQSGKILDTLKEKRVPAAFFCTLDQLKNQHDLITRMINEGHIVGNHSARHPDFSTLSRAKMAKELRDFDCYLRTEFGYTAPFFRFPEGVYSESALDAVHDLGYRSVFWSLAYSDYDVEHRNGRDFAYRTVTARLHPGAVILLHSVSSDNADALGDIIDFARSEGYTFKSLWDLP